MRGLLPSLLCVGAYGLLPSSASDAPPMDASPLWFAPAFSVRGLILGGGSEPGGVERMGSLNIGGRVLSATSCLIAVAAIPTR